MIGWPIEMIALLVVVGLAAPDKWPFVVAAFLFGAMSFANVPAMQMRVMKFRGKALELAPTANISAFNIANARGGIIDAAVIDSTLGATAIAFSAAVVPILSMMFILTQERKPHSGV